MLANEQANRWEDDRKNVCHHHSYGQGMVISSQVNECMCLLPESSSVRVQAADADADRPPHPFTACWRVFIYWPDFNLPSKWWWWWLGLLSILFVHPSCGATVVVSNSVPSELKDHDSTNRYRKRAGRGSLIPLIDSNRKVASFKWSKFLPASSFSLRLLLFARFDAPLPLLNLTRF